MIQITDRRESTSALKEFVDKVLPKHRKYFLKENEDANELDFLESLLEIYSIELSDYIRYRGLDFFDNEVYKIRRIIEYLKGQILRHADNFEPVTRKYEESIEGIENKVIGNKRILTLDEAARYSGFSKSFLYKCSSKGLFEFSKPNGKTIFIDREVFENWLLSRKSKSKEEIEKEAMSYCTISNRKGGNYGKSNS